MRMVEKRCDSCFDSTGGIGRARRVASETSWLDAKCAVLCPSLRACYSCGCGSSGGAGSESRSVPGSPARA